MSEPIFKPVTPAVNFPAIEERVLAFWQQHGTFAKSLNATRSNKAYVFYDGPPFATGLPHYGHLLAGTIKDIVPRYWTMRGNFVDRRFGWDCHGLPVENEMEKEFKVSGKRDIEKIGIHLFNEACRSIVLRYTKQWERVVGRMGRWVDFVNQYRTMDPPYMESIWWVFKQLWDKQLLYQGFRVQPYCPRCATPLSNFELNEGYKETQDPSVTVAMPLCDDPLTQILVWTTTPWTLPSNVVLAVGADIRYVKVLDGTHTYILAKDRLSSYYKDPSKFTVVGEMSGHELVGLRYTPLFDYFKDRSPAFFQITAAEFVSVEDGTGVVHIAPAFGEDDFAVGKKLGLPMVCPVDDEGKFTAEVPEHQGVLVFEANSAILTRIKEMGRLIHRSTVNHRYPFCYRCDTPLIQKAITTWFLKIEPLKPAMQAGNATINWVPEHLQHGRFGKGIESAPDWNISRNRYWGTPLPVWICPGCSHQECVGSLNEFHTLAGKGDAVQGKALHAAAAQSVQNEVQATDGAQCRALGLDESWGEKFATTAIAPDDVHRHVVDRVAISCPACGKATMHRTPEVLDCWFESGSMPYAQLHYPFENKERFLAGFPADFIAEGLDQTRGWFYTLTVLSAALFGKPAFKNVIVNGIILSEEGKKLSKRLRNYAPPDEILNRLGADALRLFLINSPAVKAEDLRFSEKGVLEMSRAVLLPLWNAYSFFVTYATVDNWKPSANSLEPPVSEHELDRWIVSLLQTIIGAVNAEMERYNLYRVVPLLLNFIDNLTNWYIRRSRRRFWKSENDTDKNSAYATLYYVLVEFARTMAPFLPFLTEEMYGNLVVGKVAGVPESIHLRPFPTVHAAGIDAALVDKMEVVRTVVGMGRTLRSRFCLRNRQPLASLTIVVKDLRRRALLESMVAIIAEELNVKTVRFDDNEDVLVVIAARPNFKRLGKKLGPRMKEASTVIEQFTPLYIRAIEAGNSCTVCDSVLTFEDLEIRRTKRSGIEVETGADITVALDTQMTPDLVAEGFAREVINRIQTIRKNRELNVTDRIVVTYAFPAAVAAAIEQFADLICGETLCRELRADSTLSTGADHEKVEIDDMAGIVRVVVQA